MIHLLVLALVGMSCHADAAAPDAEILPAAVVYLVKPATNSLITDERLAKTGLTTKVLPTAEGFTASRLESRSANMGPLSMLVRRKEGERPEVLLHVKEDGTVGGVWVFNTKNRRLVKALSEACSEWRFNPARLNGQAVDTLMTMPFEIMPMR